jgi:type IV secretory pathway TrbD component
MSRLAHAWRAMEQEQRLASVASVGLLATMFFPWYGLQSLDRKTGTISSHSINAFGDVSFVEAAVFLVSAAVIVVLVARVEGREFHLPGGDGTIVMVAGAWAALLIFYRVFSRPAGNGYPVGIEWGFFLAFVAAGGLAYAGWRMRGVERPEPPATRRPPRQPPPTREPRPRESSSDTDVTALVGASPRPHRARSAPVAAEPRREDPRPRYPPAPPGSRPAAEAEQLSFEDSPAEQRSREQQ